MRRDEELKQLISGVPQSANSSAPSRRNDSYTGVGLRCGAGWFGGCRRRPMKDSVLAPQSEHPCVIQ